MTFSRQITRITLKPEIYTDTPHTSTIKHHQQSQLLFLNMPIHDDWFIDFFTQHRPPFSVGSNPVDNQLLPLSSCICHTFVNESNLYSSIFLWSISNAAIILESFFRMDRTTSHLWPRPGLRPDRTKNDIKHDGEMRMTLMMMTDDPILFLWWHGCLEHGRRRSHPLVSRRRPHFRRPWRETLSFLVSDVRTNKNYYYGATLLLWCCTIVVTERWYRL